MIELNRIAPEMKQFDVSTFDYKETLAALESIYKEMWECCNISLLPLGSKLQAVAVSIFCYVYADIRLVYAIPKEYNATQYSAGCKETWKIEFGAMHDLRQKLNAIGRLFILDCGAIKTLQPSVQSDEQRRFN